MDLDEETLKKLLETFRAELDEHLQIITDGLLHLEKGTAPETDKDKIIETIFRSAHNIKGAARGIGVAHVGDIAHHIETLFSAFQKKTLTITSPLIDLCLEAIDCMRAAMLSFTDHQPLSFNLDDLLTRLKCDVATPAAPPIPAPETLHEAPILSESKEHETIRVSIDNLDHISAFMEEIQISKIALDAHYTDLMRLAQQIKQLVQTDKQMQALTLNNPPNGPLQKWAHHHTDQLLEINHIAQQLQKNMRARTNELSILSSALQEEVRTLRLVPAAVLLKTLPRMVRDLAHQLNKTVDLTMTGDGVKLDKLILEGLQGPMMHLLRNAIDHGIEAQETRLAKGKPENGQIRIDVREEGDHILISLSDDGAGIDLQKVTAEVLQKQWATPEELKTMGPTDLLDFIFRPGFSTKEIITDVSGRGVGLDVVKSNLLHLKGQVSITTVADQGTTFLLKVPLTLASERGLMIKSGGQPFMLPISLVDRVFLLPVQEVLAIEATQAVSVDSHPVPLRVLSDLIGLPKQAVLKNDRLPLVIMRKEHQVVALLVDDILGEREMVVKPLRPPLIQVDCVAGGTLAPNGEIILVLNASDLIYTAFHSAKNSPVHFKGPEEAKPLTRPHILVVDDSITTRTLEKNILESKNYQVTVAVNGKDAWDLLQTKSFSLLITDVTMPIMDGFTLTEQVKQNEKLRSLPVIIVTSLNSESEKKRGVEVGANAYIVKNEFESSSLLEIVQQLV